MISEKLQTRRGDVYVFMRDSYGGKPTYDNIIGFVVLCIFSHSNKNTQLDATINRKIYCFVVQTLLCTTKQ